MSSEVRTSTTRTRCHNISVSRPRKLSFPVDYYCEVPIGRLATGAQDAYILDHEDPESARRLGHGRHQVCGGRQVIALEAGHRLFLAPTCDCVIEYSAGGVRLIETGTKAEHLTVGVKRMPRQTIVAGADVESLFRAISGICSLPGETSPYRSHPLFRSPPPEIRLSPENSGVLPSSRNNSICLRLPPDLRYLYAAAPLSYYLGASVEAGDEPSLDVEGKSLWLPPDYRQFERWMGKVLSRTFQADCAVRCEAARGCRLPGIDIKEITGYSPEELMLMTMADRFPLYLETLGASGRSFSSWHTASYVDPVPRSIEVLPYLMRSLSAIYAPAGTPLSERDVVSLSVRNFTAQQAGRARGDADPEAAVILPSLHNAQIQQWYADGCPVDATLSGPVALKNGRNYARDRRMPEICVIGNEPFMAKESALLKELLEGVASVEVRADPGRSDLVHTFSEGFDVVHYAGHCDRQGLICRDGHADLSSVGACDVPVFFLNACTSYVQGIRLMERGAVCGLATMFRLLDEAAVDVCAGFYRMLARGYPIMTAYLGARECSATGKEYLLIGDGFYKVFESAESPMPFYKLSRNGLGFAIQCKMPGVDKGLIFSAGNGRAIADTGMELAGLKADDLPQLEEGLDGMCLYGSCLYDGLADAVRAALIDLKRTVSMAPAKSGSERPLPAWP